MIAVHLIFTTYGFWLPNDPRGSQSDFVWAWELFWFGGKATDLQGRRSTSGNGSDRWRREAVRDKLKYLPVRFESGGPEGKLVLQAFKETVVEFGMRVYACSLMHEHVHLVLRTGRLDIRGAVNQLKGHASRRLVEAGVHPRQNILRADGSRPSMWAEKYWKVFLNREEDVVRSIRYVEENPAKEGLKRQRFSFVEAWTGDWTRGDVGE